MASDKALLALADEWHERARSWGGPDGPGALHGCEDELRALVKAHPEGAERVKVETEGQWRGWVFLKHADGQWVSAAKLNDFSMAVYEAGLSALPAKEPAAPVRCTCREHTAGMEPWRDPACPMHGKPAPASPVPWEDFNDYAYPDRGKRLLANAPAAPADLREALAWAMDHLKAGHFSSNCGPSKCVCGRDKARAALASHPRPAEEGGLREAAIELVRAIRHDYDQDTGTEWIEKATEALEGALHPPAEGKPPESEKLRGS